MRQITKKYFFKCRLEGTPVDLSDYNTDETWDELIPILIEIGLISKDPKTNISTDINKNEDNEDRWYFQYRIRIIGSDHKPSTWTPELL